jgi:general secretion pathway protein I
MKPTMPPLRGAGAARGRSAVCGGGLTARVRDAGFTLVEVMLALAILGLALTMLMRSAAGSLFATSQAQMLGTVTDLARGKMYDLEEKTIKDGFSDTEVTEEGNFEAEGFASVEWESKIEPVELPGFETVQEIGKAAAADGGKGLASRAGAPVPGAGSGSAVDPASAQSATTGFLQQFYPVISQVLKTSIRKVTLVVKWKVLGRDRDLKVITYVTDSAAMLTNVDQIVGALGGGQGGGSGSGSGEEDPKGSGSGSGSGSGEPRTRGGFN